MSTIANRFQVSREPAGLLMSFPSMADATRYGDGLDCSPPHDVEIYDCMARPGKPQLWQRLPPSPGPAGRCYDDGDRRTALSYWKCVRVRGGPRMTDLSRSREIWTREQKGK